MALINRRWPKIAPQLYDHQGPTPPEPDGRGQTGLTLEADGRTISLVSPLNPEREGQQLAAKWISQINQSDRNPIAVFGFLLGYHLEYLLKGLAPEARLLAFEARPDLLRAALERRDFTKLLNDPRLEIVLGPFPPSGSGLAPSTVIFQAPVVSRSLAWAYQALRPPAEPAPPGLYRGPKPLNRIIIFDFGYYLTREVAESLKDLGLEAARWRPGNASRIQESDFRALLKLIKTFRPQLLFTVNHLGFDESGLLADTLARLKLPAASWFVDSPYLILNAAAPQLGPWISAFSWDRDYLPRLKTLGAENNHFLPLAAAPAYFQPRPVKISLTWAFAGDSLERATDKYLARLELTREDLPPIDEAAREFLNLPDLNPGEIAERYGQPPALNRPAKYPAGPAARTDLEALITWRASAELRSQILGALAEAEPNALTIAGDTGWRRRLPGRLFQLRPEVDYYGELSLFYQSGQVNLNITSAQMKNGLNQRIFDVPASGAFLLTDFKEQLAEVFELDKEVVFYRHPQEALDKARWYARRPQARREVTDRARARIAGQHTYQLRLNQLLTLAAADHGLKWPA